MPIDRKLDMLNAAGDMKEVPNTCSLRFRYARR